MHLWIISTNPTKNNLIKKDKDSTLKIKAALQYSLVIVIQYRKEIKVNKKKRYLAANQMASLLLKNKKKVKMCKFLNLLIFR